MAGQQRVETPEVSFSLAGEELTLRDEAGGGEVLVELDCEVSLTRATTSWFTVPMDAGVSFTTESLRVPNNSAVWFRDTDGDTDALLTDQEITAPGGTFIDISASMKVVVYVEEGPIRGWIDTANNTETACVEFDQPTRIALGVRSMHEAPTATMRIPDDAESLMRAVSHLGSSIKEWSAERSWPTLRGHPPAIETGDELDIPDRLSAPDTGVTVAVPENTADVLRIAPLAHYFGAEVVPGEVAELRICGHAEPLGTGAELERAVDELLARGLVLDSLVRIGGYYAPPLYEYEELAPELPFYPPELYDRSVDRQLLEYLEVPFDVIEPHAPRWSVDGTLRPTVQSAEALPHLLNVLGCIRVTEDAQPRPDTRFDPTARLSTATKVPAGTAALTPAARTAARTSQREPQNQASVLVVGAAQSAADRFRQTNWEHHVLETPPTWEARAELTRQELLAALRADHLYIHYGGPVTDEGFVCTDGTLRFEALPPAGVGAISFDWPRAETSPVEPVLESTTVACLSEGAMSADTISAFAKYLVLGFCPARAAGFAGIRDAMRFVGDASRALSDRANGSPPVVFDIEPTADGQYVVSFASRPTRVDILGSTGHPNLEKYDAGTALSGNSTPLPGKFSTADVASLAENDYLLRVHGPVPEAVPTESVIHACRKDGEPDESTPSKHARNEEQSRH
jgi:hypothetical protein